MAKKAPNPIDKHVGSRVRMRRMMLGMSQEKLGDALGLTFQQVQKYEKGTNRIGASRLQHIASILGVTISFFFEGLPSETNAARAQAIGPLAAIGVGGWHLGLPKVDEQLSIRIVRTAIDHGITLPVRDEFLASASPATGAAYAVSTPTLTLHFWKAWNPNCANGCVMTPTAR